MAVPELELKEMAKAWTEALFPRFGLAVEAVCHVERKFLKGCVYRAKIVISAGAGQDRVSYTNDWVFWSKYSLSEKDAWKDLSERYSSPEQAREKTIWLGTDLSWAFPVCSSAAELRLKLAAAGTR